MLFPSFCNLQSIRNWEQYQGEDSVLNVDIVKYRNIPKTFLFHLILYFDLLQEVQLNKPKVIISLKFMIKFLCRPALGVAWCGHS